ncbi:MAG: glycosyltransferase [Thermomicrobiales bacterium]|nr:glycosyltransferase [Thermomicrobiales bacterium]
MTLAPYGGPAVFGYETDTPLRRAAQISVHTSPLATLGGKDAGGMNVYIRELATHLAAQGLPVDIFTRRTDPETPEVREIVPGVNVIAITAGPVAEVGKNDLFPYLPDFAEEMALYSLRAGTRYDVVHAHYWLSGWVAELARRYWNTPFVQMFHTTAHMKNAVSGQQDQETDLRLKIENQLLTLADGLIAANPDERADLIWRMGVPTEKVCTIPPGVDLQLFQPQPRDAARARLGLAPDDLAVLFVGRIDPIKGIDRLVEAAELILTQGQLRRPPVFVVVGGDLTDAGQPVGPLANVAADIEARGLSDHFRLLGSWPQDQLPVAYSAADVVAVPSRYESFGLVAVEALACGAPVVASRAGGLRFTIDEGVSGLLVKPQSPRALADGLTTILTDDRLRAAMSSEARPSVERYDWSAIAADVMHVYRRLASGHRAHLCAGRDLFAATGSD